MNDSIAEFPGSTDREILSNIVPRLKNVEKAVDKQSEMQERHENRLDNLDQSVNDLRRDLSETESRLSQRIDQRFDSVDDHLSAQDIRLDKVIGEKKKWSDSLIAAFLIAGGTLVMILIEVAHSLKWF